MPDNRDELRQILPESSIERFPWFRGSPSRWHCGISDAGEISRRASGDAGAEYGTPARESIALTEEVAALKTWAAENSLLIQKESLPDLHKGGREHHTLDPQTASAWIYKITIGPEFGYIPICYPKRQFRDVCHWFSTETGLPSQYFQRLQLLNALFPRCETQLAGFVSRGESLHAITAQRIAWGHPADSNRISSWLLSQGFVFISAWTWFRPADRVALFDVMEKNIMECGDPDLVPFDVIPLRSEGQFLEMMQAAVERLG
jgi:hypothetical protein